MIIHVLFSLTSIAWQIKDSTCYEHLWNYTALTTQLTTLHVVQTLPASDVVNSFTPCARHDLPHDQGLDPASNVLPLMFHHAP